MSFLTTRARLAYETVREMMAAAVDEPEPNPAWLPSSRPPGHR